MSEKAFDFEKFIAGMKPGTITVPIYAVDNRHAIAELQRLIEQADSEPSEPTRLGVPSKVATLAKQAKKLRDEMEASATNFTFKSLTSDSQNRFIAREDSDSLEAMCDQLAEQSVEPVLTSEQWQMVAAKIGAPQFNKLFNAATALTMSEVVTPDFSQATSEALNPRASDEN